MTYDFKCPVCTETVEVYTQDIKEYEDFVERGAPCPHEECPGLMKYVWAKSKKHMKIFLKGSGFTRREA